jgi:hypothetical protein
LTARIPGSVVPAGAVLEVAGWNVAPTIVELLSK